MNYEPPEIPQSVIDAATTLHNWFELQGSNRWELMNICSRNHAHDLRIATTLMEQSESPFYEAMKVLKQTK